MVFGRRAFFAHCPALLLALAWSCAGFLGNLHHRGGPPRGLLYADWLLPGASRSGAFVQSSTTTTTTTTALWGRKKLATSEGADASEGAGTTAANEGDAAEKKPSLRRRLGKAATPSDLPSGGSAKTTTVKTKVGTGKVSAASKASKTRKGLNDLDLDLKLDLSLGSDPADDFDDIDLAKIGDMFDEQGRLRRGGSSSSGGGGSKKAASLSLDIDGADWGPDGLDGPPLDLDIDVDELVKMAEMFPLDDLDEENEKELAEALRGIEEGNFDLSDFLEAGDDKGERPSADLTRGLEEGGFEEEREDNVDMIGDVDLFAELGGGRVRGGDREGDMSFDVGGGGGADDEERDILRGVASPRAAAGVKGKGGKAKADANDGAKIDALLQLSELTVDEPAPEKAGPRGAKESKVLRDAKESAKEAKEAKERDSSGVAELPPLEEFKRLMESLGPDSLFDDDSLFREDEDDEVDEEMVLAGKQWRIIEGERVVVEMRDTPDGEVMFVDWGDDNGPVQYNGEELPSGPLLPRIDADEDEYFDAFAPNVYEGGRMASGFDKYMDNDTVHRARQFNRYLYLNEPDEAQEARVRIVSVVTNSSANSTALTMVQQVYDFIRKGIEEDLDRVDFEIHCYKYVDKEQEDAPGEGLEELDNMIQMWLEGYNTYHLIDGFAMREAWGAIMPHIMGSDKNLQAILDQVKWALHEDTIGGALLTPRMRRIRFRGGAQEMVTGYNTEELDAEFSVVSVR